MSLTPHNFYTESIRFVTTKEIGAKHLQCHKVRMGREQRLEEAGQAKQQII